MKTKNLFIKNSLSILPISGKKSLSLRFILLIILLGQLNIGISQSIPSYLPTNGLVGWWPFNGNANDESDSLNNGIANGATLTTDRLGNVNSAYYANGTNAYINTPAVIQNVVNTFSISLWVNPLMPDNIITQGITGYEGYGNQPVIHPTHGSNWGDESLNAGVGVYVGTNQIEIIEHTHLYVAAPIVYNTTLVGWHHIVVVYNNHVPSLYLDGLLVKVGLASSIQNVHPSNGFDAVYPTSGFGRSFSPNGTPVAQFNGSFDDIGIYNRVLTSAEISGLYTASLLQNDTSICKGGSVTLYASGSNQIQNITSLTREWSNNYSTSNGIFRKALLFDSSLVISGSNWPSWPSGTTDQMITKIGTDGSLKWRNVRAPGSDHDGFNSVYRYPSGNLLFFGQENAQGTDYFDGFWTRFDENGNELNFGFFKVPGSTSGSDVIRLPNGNFAFSGPDQFSTYLAITDSNLNQLKYVTYPSGGWFASRLLCDAQNIYSVTFSNLSNFTVVKYDLLLNQIDSYDLPNNGATTNSLNDAKLIDGYIYLVGNKVVNGITYGVVYKLNTNGVIVDSYVDTDQSDYTALAGKNHKVFFAKSYLNSSGESTLNKIIEFVGNGQIGLQYTMNNGAAFCSTDLNMDDNYMYASGVSGPKTIGIPAVEKIKINYSSSHENTTYRWSTGDTTNSINVTPPQTTKYYCTVSNGIISFIDSVTVTVSDLSTFNPLQDTTKACGISTTLDAGPGFTSYSWSTGATTQTISPTSSGNYTVTVTNICDSSAIDSTYLSIVNANIINNDTVVCVGSSVSLFCQTAKVSIPVAINNYSLYHQAGGYYADPVNDDYVTFPVSSTLNANYPTWTMECWAKITSPQEEGILSIGNPEHLGGNVIMSKWTPQIWAYGNTNSGLSVTNKIINYSTAAWNHYALSYNNGTYRLFLNGILQESWNSGNNVFINNVYPLMTNTHWWWRGGNVQSHRMTVFYDDIRVSKSCRYSSNFIPTNNWQNDPNTLGLWNFNEGSGQIAYDLSGNNNNGIITGATYKTDVPPVNTTEFDSNSYLWTTGDTTETINVTPTKTTTYYCTVRNGISSCVDSVTLTVSDLSTFNPLQDTTKACGISTTLDAGPGFNSYNWNTGDTTQTISPTSSGNYTVTVTNTCDSSAIDSTFLSIVNANILNNDTAICKGASVTLTTSGNVGNGILSDIDGNIYPTVQIGTQLWLQKNVSVSKYKNGDIIPQITDPSQWASLTSGAWCWYNNDSATYGATYGKLYNWYAARDPRGLAPEGWHVPTDMEWMTLTDFLGGAVVAGGKMKEGGTIHWNSPNTGATNESGFSGLPGPARLNNGQLDDIGSLGSWWSSTESGSTTAWSRYLHSSSSSMYGSENTKEDGFSVRFMKNSPITLLWSTGDTTNSINVTPNETTTYYCTVSNDISSCMDSVTVTVNALPIIPTINWNGTELSIPSTGIGYQWQLNNSLIVNATNDAYKPTEIGNYKIEITDVNGCKNVSDSFMLVVTALNPSIETSIDHIAKIIPNPASTNVMLYFKQKPTKTLTVKLLSLNGQLLKQLTTNSQTTNISLSEIISGNYIIKIIGKDYNQAQKLLITK